MEIIFVWKIDVIEVKNENYWKKNLEQIKECIY